MDHGTTLRMVRKAKGLTQAAVADAAGISQAYLGRLEVGAYAPTLRVARALAAALGSPLDALWPPNTPKIRPLRARRAKPSPTP